MINVLIKSSLSKFQDVLPSIYKSLGVKIVNKKTKDNININEIVIKYLIFPVRLVIDYHEIPEGIVLKIKGNISILAKIVSMSVLFLITCFALYFLNIGIKHYGRLNYDVIHLFIWGKQDKAFYLGLPLSIIGWCLFYFTLLGIDIIFYNVKNNIAQKLSEYFNTYSDNEEVFIKDDYYILNPLSSFLVVIEIVTFLLSFSSFIAGQIVVFYFICSLILVIYYGLRLFLSNSYYSFLKLKILSLTNKGAVDILVIYVLISILAMAGSFLYNSKCDYYCYLQQFYSSNKRVNVLLTNVIKNSNEETRLRKEAILSVRNKELIPMLKSMLNDKSPEIREAAKKALNSLKDYP